MSAQQPTFCEMVPNHYYTTNRLARYIYVIGSCLDKNSPPQLPMIYLEYGVTMAPNGMTRIKARDLTSPSATLGPS